MTDNWIGNWIEFEFWSYLDKEKLNSNSFSIGKISSQAQNGIIFFAKSKLNAVKVLKMLYEYTPNRKQA